MFLLNIKLDNYDIYCTFNKLKNLHVSTSNKIYMEFHLKMLTIRFLEL